GPGDGPEAGDDSSWGSILVVCRLARRRRTAGFAGLWLDRPHALISPVARHATSMKKKAQWEQRCDLAAVAEGANRFVGVAFLVQDNGNWFTPSAGPADCRGVRLGLEA